MQVNEGHSEAVFLVGAVEFAKDMMKKQLAMQKIRPGDKEFETSDSPYRDRVILLEILHDNKVAGQIELSLLKYVGHGLVQEQFTYGPKNQNELEVRIELTEILDDD